MKVVLLALAAAALLALLFGVVFPWVDRNLLADPVMGAVGSAAAWVWRGPDTAVPSEARARAGSSGADAGLKRSKEEEAA